jgi:hypothetical protein
MGKYHAVKMAVEFLSAFVRDWVALMSGIAAVLLGIVGASSDQPLERRWFWIAAVICYLVASFRVWRAEHLAYLADLSVSQSLDRDQRDVAIRLQHAQLIKQERENGEYDRQRERTNFDDAVLKLVNKGLADLAASGLATSNFGFLNSAWVQDAASELGVDGEAVRESLKRLRSAARLPNLLNQF